MNLQEIFNQAYLGLKSQGFKRSGIVDEDGSFNCLYKMNDNLKCAIGWIIPDDKYSPKLDECHIQEVLELVGFDATDAEIQFCAYLQAAHDGSKTPEIMQLKLEQFAKACEVVIPND